MSGAPQVGEEAPGDSELPPGLRHPACASCGGQTRWWPHPGGLQRCGECGFVAFHPADSAALAELYDESYFTGAEYTDYLGEADALRRSMRRHLQQMARYAPLGGALLEVGCAYGLFLDEARAHFSSVAGIDVCDGPVAHARNVLGLRATCGDFLAQDWGGERFDAICLWDTIEHLPAPDLFVRRARELLTDGGMLYMTTGDIGALNARLRGRHWRQIHPPTHVNYFSRATMRRMLERCGFTVAGFETAAYFHSAHNVLSAVRRRGGLGSLPARLGLALLGPTRARRLGSWLNLGDIMFVAASLGSESLGSESRRKGTH